MGLPFKSIFHNSYCFAGILIVLVLIPMGCGPPTSAISRFWEKTPGLWLGGRSAPEPERWESVNRFQTAKIETYFSFVPYVVTVGYVGTDLGLYVMAQPSSVWLGRLNLNPDVRVRIGELTYLLKAQILEDPQELRLALSAYNQKYNEWIQKYYGFGLTPENLHEYLIPIRLDDRTGVF